MSRRNHVLGFIGTGRMGFPMALNLLKEWNNMIVYNRTRSKLDPLVDMGAIAASNPKEVADKADIIFLMLSDERAIMDVLFGEKGLMFSEKLSGKIVIDSSTLYLDAWKKIKEEINKAGARFFMAPVLGGPAVAESAELVILASGDQVTFDVVKPYLETLSREIYYFGDNYKAAVAKLIYNTFSGGFVALMAETLLVAKMANIDERVMLDILKESAFKTVIEKYQKRMFMP